MRPFIRKCIVVMKIYSGKGVANVKDPIDLSFIVILKL